MARTTATNFTGALQFPYATAAADLFKKEDVQTLALATDGHDHSSGKGLPVALAGGSVTTPMLADNAVTTAKILDGTIVGSDIAGRTIQAANIATGTITSLEILDGTITSADLADGTIATVDVAANAIQNIIGQYNAVPSFSTTTTSTWLVTPIAVTFVSTGRPVRIDGQTSLLHSAAAATVLVAIFLDGSQANSVALFNSPGVNYAEQVAWTVYMTPASGTHTVALYVQTINAGTLAITGSVQSQMTAVEQLR